MLRFLLIALPEQVRAFKIGMALEFRAHVIAFTTLDLLVGVSFSVKRRAVLKRFLQIHWAPDRNSLPNRYIDIYENPLGFLYVFLRWIDHQLQRNGTAMRKRQLPVVTLIRSECQLFAGIGVYTLCEILYLAGEFSFLSIAASRNILSQGYHRLCENTTFSAMRRASRVLSLPTELTL